ncbi:cytochrome b561 and DOMON domain-containing protein At3g07570-like [Prosopis cineraria]|uniref:cytochrome b561 and DOMON domain-containing protein At3g07570-like n=1 Tax=Prosopis cineraria TaxID=364024 RepID=UPI0024102A77|nr:cytochrome b561 and DOMON domain-containing protein At3g07570-like [Prosopis cineraria]
MDYASGRADVISTLKLKRSRGWLNIEGWTLMMWWEPQLLVSKQWDPLWFYSLASIQTLAFGAGIAGFISGLSLSHKLSSNVTRHKIIGILVLVLGCLQVLALVLRPGKKSKVLRKFWNYYHHNIGRILMMFAIFNSFYGLHLGREESKWFTGYGAIVSFLVLVAIILEIIMQNKTWTPSSTWTTIGPKTEAGKHLTLLPRTGESRMAGRG